MEWDNVTGLHPLNLKLQCEHHSSMSGQGHSVISCTFIDQVSNRKPKPIKIQNRTDSKTLHLELHQPDPRDQRRVCGEQVDRGAAEAAAGGARLGHLQDRAVVPERAAAPL